MIANRKALVLIDLGNSFLRVDLFLRSVVLCNSLKCLLSNPFLIIDIIHTILFNHRIGPLPESGCFSFKVGENTQW